MLKNLIFSIIFFSGIIVISLIFLPTLILPQALVLSGGKLLGHWMGFCLRLILSVKIKAVSYTHLRAHETGRKLVCRLLLEKKKLNI